MPATLSQIMAWSTEHLIDAAAYWTQTADRWEDAFPTMRNQAQSITWHGAGGGALRQRTGADLSVVSGKADLLRQAAGIARSGASDISAAQRRVLYGVEDAQNAGFAVGEDLSVTDIRSTSPAELAARQAQAEAFAADIRVRAEHLDGADAKVAGQQAPPPATPMPAFGPRPDPGPQPAPGPMPPYVPPQSFGQCVGGQVKANVGKEMVKSGYENAIKGAIGGAIAGGVATPELAGAGAIPGAVAGFVGGFVKGLVEAPVKSAVEGAVECADIPIPGLPKP